MKVLLISTNAGRKMGGEAIKTIQYFEYLLSSGFDVILITHERCRRELEGNYPYDRIAYMKDTKLQALAWRSRAFRFFYYTSVSFECPKIRSSI